MYSAAPYQVSFAETNAMGVVHHSNHNRFFERGRIEFLRSAGILYSELSENGIHFPVLKTACTYKRPLHFDDIILIESRLVLLSRTRISFSYRIITGQKAPKLNFDKNPVECDSIDIATLGFSEHCCLAPDGKPKRVPDWIQNALEPLCMNEVK